ncbi:MAG: hypothetical protein NTY15_01935 [Planctomycetota bacterium]|nr:hypothetical protein [Planctomycetota bacterium]
MFTKLRIFLGITFCAFGATSNAQKPNANSTSARTELTAQDRLAASTSLYKSIRTYCDNGLLTQEFSIQGRQIKNEMPFRTAFERGGRFRWQFRHSATPGAKPDQLFAIWSSDSKSFDSFWTLNSKRQTGQKLDTPLASATGISGGAATAIIPLLQIDKDGSAWGMMTTDLLKPEVDGQEEVDKVKCWKIKGKAKFGDTKISLWIDGEGLIRKIDTETVVDPSKISDAVSKNILKTPVFTTYTTITFKPVINEAKIDDSKFAQEDK